jgi:hypothetical protein
MPAVRIIDEHLQAPVLVYSGSGGVFTNELELVVEDGLKKERDGNKLIIKGQTFDSDLTVSLGEGRSFGRYASGETIPAQGKTFAELIQMAIVEPIAPTVSITTSTTVQFNQTSISNVINFSHTINSLNASTSAAILETRRGGTGAWTQISSGTSASGTFTHTLTDTSFNTSAFNYRYVVTDSVGATATATLDITPAAYQAPTISLTVNAVSLTGPEGALKREKGNIASTLSGTVTRNSSLVSLSSYTLQRSIDNVNWSDIGGQVAAGPGTFSIPSTSHNDADLIGASALYYRVKVMDAYQQHLSTTGVTGGNKTVNFLNIVTYGPSTSSITISAAVRSLGSRIFTDGTNPFNLETGNTLKIFTVALPHPTTITQVLDLDALNTDVTAQYQLVEGGQVNGVFVQATDASNPVLSIPTSVHESQITQLAAGNNFALALDATGRVHAWGSNSNGQLNVPNGALSGVTKITAGHGFAYVLKSDGTVLGWGDSAGNRFDYSGLTGITDIFSGWFETLFINSLGAVLRRGNSTGVVPNFNISSWSSGVTDIAVGRYNMIALRNGGAYVTGHSNHLANTTPEYALAAVSSVHAHGGTTLWAKSETNIYGWGKADSGEMSQLHSKIAAGALGPNVTSTYTPGPSSSAHMTIRDPEGVIRAFIPSQGYQLGIVTADGDVVITGTGSLSAATLSAGVSEGVISAAIGDEFIVALSPNSDRRFFVDDAGGTATQYNVYTMTNAIPYSDSHRHQITRG